VSFDFTGKRVIVTGGTRGIGRAAVEAFLAAGATVAVNGRSEESTHNAVVRLGARAIPAPGDITRPDACRAMVANAARQMDGLDVLVNCAGVAHGGPVDEVTEAVWDSTLNANLKGTFFCTQAALLFLRMSKGNVVNLASDAGLIGEAGLAVYSASKGGVVNLTRALALELAPDIRVNCVCPGYVDTDMVRSGINASAHPERVEAALAASAPLNRIAKPEEIAGAILYLASDQARFVTGAAFQIDGGTTAGHPRR